MKKVFVLLITLTYVVNSYSQDVSVEKSVFGIQTGFLGTWIHNESKLTYTIAIRSEFGLDANFFGNYYDKNNFLLAPVIIIEPKWYYNLKKRAKKSRKIDGNSGNFISLKIGYHPDWFTISNLDDIRIVSDVSIIPTWGIRRSIGNHFNYETGIGIGYVYYFAKDAGFFEDKSEAALNLHLRIGYRF